MALPVLASPSLREELADRAELLDPFAGAGTIPLAAKTWGWGESGAG